MLLSVSSRPSIPIFLLIPSTLLLVAYLYALYTRPPLPPHAKISDPGKFGWPEWYAKGGQTPYDVSLGQGDGEVCDERRSVLLFIDLPYDHPKIPHALEVLTTLESDANVELRVITPWLESWRDDQKTRKNVEDAGCGEWVWRIGDHVRDLDGACAGSVLISEIVSKSFGSTDLLPYDPRANVTIMSQPHDLVHPERSFQSLSNAHGDAWAMGLFSHILPYADHHNYYPAREVMNRKRITYFPRRETPSADYPSMPWGRDWHLYRPDRLSPPPKHIGVDPLKAGSAYRRYWSREEAKRAAAMRESGVCLFEGWSSGILDERIAQAMLSGCVVAAVQPDVQHDVLAPLIIPLTPLPDDGLPSEELNRILAKLSTSELKRKALHAFILARQKFVPIAGVRAVLDAAKRWEQGGRGYLFPHGWRWTCSAGGDRPPWC
ncbi:hypothetical protein DB88DRAFT_479642 [Papiliotrema laurentii]|uniref:Uncharacterized protein n=1 Tax=Papiliotrema laurentii TaxID=5418 RepID=A0AAD9FX63_PAPLA|nr:hypothetical protein DB88DRAFT_479642 [Papiliotrema laurentii]